VEPDHALAAAQVPRAHRAGNARAAEALLRPRYLEARTQRGGIHRRVHRAGGPLPLSRDADTLPLPRTIGRTFRLIQRPRHMERPVR
jgi:hypothetical protein